MKSELELLERRKVWDLMNRRQNKKMIKYKWIFNT